MIAIDTNVVVRYVADDDPVQSPKARIFVDSNDVLVLTTVILEAGWVLASRHRFPPAEVARTLRDFLGLPTVSVENPLAVHNALDWVSDGLGFADALHLAQAQVTDGFATFDRNLARDGARRTTTNIRLL